MIVLNCVGNPNLKPGLSRTKYIQYSVFCVPRKFTLHWAKHLADKGYFILTKRQ